MTKALLPILSKKEENDSFLKAVSERAEEIVLLAVFDRNEMSGKFGFAANEMMQANRMLESLEKKFREKGKKAETITEWGSTSQKIANTALLRNCEKILLQKQDNQRFKELVKEIESSKDKKIAIEVV